MRGFTTLPPSDFAELGDFKDAPERLAKCNQELAYASALALLEAKDYTAASQAFADLGEFKDAPTRFSECNQALNYTKALTLLNAEDYEGAAQAFLSLGDFQNSVGYLETCQEYLALMAKDPRVLAAVRRIATEGLYNRLKYDRTLIAIYEAALLPEGTGATLTFDDMDEVFLLSDVNPILLVEGITAECERLRSEDFMGNSEKLFWEAAMRLLAGDERAKKRSTACS